MPFSFRGLLGLLPVLLPLTLALTIPPTLTSAILNTRAIDFSSYIAGALTSFRTDLQLAAPQLAWSPVLTSLAQASANQCNGDAPTGKGLRGTIYEAINTVGAFDMEYETKIALVSWLIERMQEDNHFNFDVIRDPDARFVGCAWSQNCGEGGVDHYMKCVLSATENPQQIKRDTTYDNGPTLEVREEFDSFEDFNPMKQSSWAINTFRLDNGLNTMLPHTELMHDAYMDANHCDDRQVPNELGFRITHVSANKTILTDAILNFWLFLVADWTHPLLKNPDLQSMGCSYSDWCKDNTLFFRCKFSTMPGNAGKRPSPFVPAEPEYENEGGNATSPAEGTAGPTRDLATRGGLNCGTGQRMLWCAQWYGYACDRNNEIRSRRHHPLCDKECHCPGAKNVTQPDVEDGNNTTVVAEGDKATTQEKPTSNLNCGTRTSYCTTFMGYTCDKDNRIHSRHRNIGCDLECHCDGAPPPTGPSIEGGSNATATIVSSDKGPADDRTYPLGRPKCNTSRQYLQCAQVFGYICDGHNEM